MREGDQITVILEDGRIEYDRIGYSHPTLNFVIIRAKHGRISKIVDGDSEYLVERQDPHYGVWYK